MFTGLIEELGVIEQVERREAGAVFRIGATLVASDISNGDSIAVNGVCLTAVGVDKGGFSADVSPETLARTTLDRIAVGTRVNLERALLPTQRLGGHIVQGHVDATGKFIGARDEGDFHTVTIGFDPEFAKYLVFKGSVAVEGISLTVAALRAAEFDIAVIPKTWEMTDLSTLSPGDAVNLEADVIAKYVERMLSQRNFE
ncbi:MAG: riboflavin synthase [Acidobacteria bacterium]|nr:riboflavin synthase [Acidobacteriota bacterium]